MQTKTILKKTTKKSWQTLKKNCVDVNKDINRKYNAQIDYNKNLGLKSLQDVTKLLNQSYINK